MAHSVAELEPEFILKVSCAMSSIVVYVVI